LCHNLWGPPATGAIGAAQQKEEEAAQRQDQMSNALETQYSPWLGAHYKKVRRPGSAVGKIASGLFKGWQQGDNISKGFDKMKSAWDASQPLDVSHVQTGAPMDTSQYFKKPGFRSGWQDPSRNYNTMNA